MTNFKISAPGRIILCGEHSAMYGKHFVAASLDLRTKLEFCELPDETQQIEIDFLDVNLQFNIPLEGVRRFLSENENVRMDPIRILKYVKFLITSNGMWYTFKQRSSLKIFFFLLYTIAIQQNLEIKSFRVRVSTNIPIGAGLGSSTSFAVCLAACFLHWKSLQTGNLNSDNDLSLKYVRFYAKFCEEFMQDYQCASVDTAVCVYGGIVKSRLINHTEITEFDDMTRMKILLIDSGIRQKKSNQASLMAQLKFAIPRKFETMLNRLDNLAIRMHNLLNLINDTIENPNLLQCQQHYNLLQRCIRRTHKLLKKYYLSNEAFDHTCETAHYIGFAGKLTGFGAGYVYILLSPNITYEGFINTKNYFREEGFNVIPTSINCNGVRIDI